ANPLSSFMSLFQKDLVIELIYKNHQNLIQGSDVYLAKDTEGLKTLIGEVVNVSMGESQMSTVEIRIDEKFKNKIYETTPFVLMSSVFSQNANAYIVAISSSDTTDKKLLKSGSSVKGVTFFEYKFATAGEELKKVMDNIGKQNKELLSQLDEYIDTFNTEAFQKKIDELADQVTQFSKGQKEAFKNDVLPALKNMINSIMEQLEKQNNKEKSKDLKKQLKNIEETVDV
ncbi:hypothetical protein OAT93_00990, partial [bacterium]|nr:hypothetical protein [bacterium]